VPNCASIEIIKVSEKGLLDKQLIIKIGLKGDLTSLDWSEDETTLAVNSSTNELVFINVVDQTLYTSSEAKDFKWATMTCKLGFPASGIHQSRAFSKI